MGIPYTYRITHLPSGKHYYGARYAKNCHPDDLWVKYFTSSKVVKRLIEQDGKDAFFVEVRKVFDNVISCKKWEEVVLRRLRVTKNDMWLNLALVGTPVTEKGYTRVTDGTKEFMCATDDPKFLSGEYISVLKGLVTIVLEDGSYTKISCEEYASGRYKHHCSGTTVVITDTGILKRVSVTDPKFLSGEYKSPVKGKVVVKDSSGRRFSVGVDDPRYLSGELQSAIKGQTRSEEARRNMSIAQSGREGRPWTEESKEKLRQKRLGSENPMFGVEPAIKGKNHSEESKLKMSEAQKKRLPPSESTRKKMSESRTNNTNACEYGYVQLDENLNILNDFGRWKNVVLAGYKQTTVLRAIASGKPTRQGHIWKRYSLS